MNPVSFHWNSFGLSILQPSWLNTLPCNISNGTGSKNDDIFGTGQCHLARFQPKTPPIFTPNLGPAVVDLGDET